MVLSILSLALAASAATCTLTAKPFMVGCGAAASLAAGASCKLSCLKTYRPTATTLTCSAGGVLSPVASAYSCTPIQQALFPWRAAQCTTVQFASTGFPTTFVPSLLGSPVAQLVSADEYRLTNGGTNDKGLYTYGPFRTRGSRSAFEFSFSYKAPTSGGGDGFWAILSNQAPTQVPATKGTLDLTSTSGTAIMALEIDLFLDGAEAAVPHLAVLMNPSGALTETHSATFSNLMWGMGLLTDIANGNFHTANVLVQPVSTSGNIIVTVWSDGVTVARDTILAANVPAGVTSLINTRSIVWISALSYNRASTTTVGVRTVKALRMCGVEYPQWWSRLYTNTMTRVRTCVQQASFGNPDPARVGVWKPFPCPAGIARAPNPPPTSTVPPPS